LTAYFAQVLRDLPSGKSYEDKYAEQLRLFALLHIKPEQLVNEDVRRSYAQNLSRLFIKGIKESFRSGIHARTWLVDSEIIKMRIAKGIPESVKARYGKNFHEELAKNLIWQIRAKSCEQVPIEEAKEKPDFVHHPNLYKGLAKEIVTETAAFAYKIPIIKRTN